MKKNYGFTLVELLAVIIILGLVMALILPNAMQIGNNVKQEAYEAKIDTIEGQAESYGTKNKSIIKTGANFENPNQHYTCYFRYGENGAKEDVITSVDYRINESGYSESANLGKNKYWCTRLKVEDLVRSNNLTWDKENLCSGNANCNDDNKEFYDNVVLNPKTNYIINKCYIYVYLKYNRVYAYFDKNICDIKSEEPADGFEYRQA